MVDNRLAVIFAVDRDHIEPAVGVLDAVLIKIGLRGVDDGFFLALADGAEWAAQAAERIVFNFHKDQKLAVAGDYIHLALLRSEVAGYYLKALLDQIPLGGILALIPDPFAFCSHARGAAIPMPGYIGQKGHIL